MAPRRLLVVTTVAVDESLLREQVRAKSGGEEAEIRIVAPTAELSPLQWLANDEDEERARAQRVAHEAASAVAGEASVEAQVGDSDPVKAIEDALREFPAEEVIVVTRAGEEATWLERDAGPEAQDRFGVPVTHLAVSSDESPSTAKRST